ncbi:MAG TPA: MFS transporter [Mycobacteriales bacterium]|nr:MFS transporter [Mycobacteriales bacterium]
MSERARDLADVAPDADTLRRQRRGWYFYGWASHAFPTTVVAVFMGRYLEAVASTAAGGADGRVHLLGIPVRPGSLFAYLISLSTALLVILMPVVGAVADRTGRKREIMLGFGWLGAGACVLMWFVRGGRWPLGALLFFVAFLSYSCAIVVFHSMLVDLAEPAERDRVSSFGWALGYLGGGVLLAGNFVVSFLIDDRAVVARLSLASAGVWWAAFAVVPFVALRGRLGSARPVRPADGPVLLAGFRQLAATIRRLRGFPVTLAFLVAFLVYNDGIQTVVTLSAQYGQSELRLSEPVLLSAILLVHFLAFAGALLLGWLARFHGAKRVVLGSLVVWTLVVVGAYFLAAGSILQFYGFAVVVALVLGGSQALSRSMFSHLVPRGEEAEYFGLYEVSNSGTSWLGPLIFGLALQNTGSYRTALVSLVVFFVAGFALLAAVPIRRGILAVGNTPPDRL